MIRSARTTDGSGNFQLEVILVGETDLDCVWLDFEGGLIGYEDADGTITWRDAMGGAMVLTTDAYTEEMAALVKQLVGQAGREG